MHSPSPTPPSSATDNPAPPSKTARPRLRGFSYLRGQSSSAPSAIVNTSATPDRSRPSRFARSVSSPAASGFGQIHIIDSSILPSIRDSEQAEQGTSLDRLASALRPYPTPDCEGLLVNMARNAAGRAPNSNSADGSNSLSSSPNPPSNITGNPHDQMPTIRLIPHQDRGSSRPSLSFPTTTRTLPQEDSVIRVGRYSERDTNPNPPPNIPSSAPIGFKSKVVSRKHCEFWCSNGQWYIRDMRSSSGTFLNHIRLSGPSAESKPFPVHDGDVVQLGIDFRGGEEMIFRCVKIRIEVNRGWQKTLNNYK